MSLALAVQAKLTGLFLAVTAIHTQQQTYESVKPKLALTGNLRDDSNPTPILWNKGRITRELLPAVPANQIIADTGAEAVP